MKKISMIIGARPNFMKAFPVYEALKEDFDLTLIHTGQHFDSKMSDVFFNQLKFPRPDIHLTLEKKTKSGDFDDKLYVNNEEYLKNKDTVIEELMNYDQDLGQLGEIRDKLKIEFEKGNPDLVIVFGDVTSTLAAGLAARKLNINLAHVESGLRSGDMLMPEEVNRVLTDHITNYYFITEQSGVDNLKKIGITENVYLVGNTMIDTQKKYLQQALDTKYHETLDVKSKEYVLITLHRPSNVDNMDKLKEIFDDFEELSKTETLVYPIHPRTKNNLEKLGYLKKVEENANIILDEPLGYLEFTCLMANCKYLVTDSGGLQEESTALDIPCFTLRENTERPSTLIENNGTNQMIHKISEVKIKFNNLKKRKKKKDTIIINCIGNNIVGTGHIKRQEQIVDYYKYLYNVIIITCHEDVNTYFKKCINSSIILIDNENDIFDILKQSAPVLFINDTLNSELTYMKKIKQYCPKILSYEDVGLGTKFCNKIINELYSNDIINYIDPTLDVCDKFNCGIDFFSLRSEFINYPSNKLCKNITNILITFGGTDPLNYTKLVLKFMMHFKYNEKYILNVVLGLGYKFKEDIKKFIENQKNINLYENVSNMPELIKTCNIAIASQGRTTCELLYMNVPTMSLAQNDRELLHDYCHENNGILNIGIIKNLRFEYDIEYLNKCFQVFINKYEYYFNKMKKNRYLIKNGFEKNINLINKLLKHNSSYNIKEIIKIA